MTSEAQVRWHQHRMTIVSSQVAPTFLLITTIALLQFGLAETSIAIRVATAGILLASGILGALVQLHSASEAQALAANLPENAEGASAIRKSARLLWVVKFVTPSVFVVIYVALMVALFG
jgi:hypothetical protein